MNNLDKYRGDLPHEPDLREYSSAEVNLGDTKYVSEKEAKKNAKEYIERNQFAKLSCVPGSIGNALWNTEKEILADEPNYKQRVNFPDGGCYWVDQLDLAVSFGMAKRKIAPEVKTEELVNAYQITEEIKKDAKNHRQKSYIFIKDYNDFIKVLNSGYPIVFSIFSNTKEYANSKPKVLGELTRDKATILHAICAIPNTGTKDSFWVTDSAHFGKVAKREITKEFFDKRLNFAGAYFIDLEYVEPKQWATPAKYKGYKFTKDLTIGSKGEDVIALQEILKANGYFPDNIGITGNFFGITRQAVKDFQADYPTILQSVGLTKPTGFFGKATRNKINELLS